MKALFPKHCTLNIVVILVAFSSLRGGFLCTYHTAYRTLFQDDLWGNAIFLKEANAISVELKKKVS